MKKSKRSAWIILILFVTIPIHAVSKKQVLENGLTLIIDRDSNSHTSCLQLYIRGGKRSEPAMKGGLAYLTTRLSIELPDSHQKKQITEMASKIDFRITAHYCLITISCLSQYFGKTLEIFSENLTNPLFSGLRINRTKNHMEYLQKWENDQDIKRLRNTLGQIFFRSPRYRGSIYGDTESLKNISRDDIRQFHRSYFTGHNITVAVSSSLPESELSEMLTENLTAIPSGEPIDLPTSGLNRPEKRNHQIYKDKIQYLIARATVSPEIIPNNFSQIFLLENLLGKGPGSEMWKLRAEEGLAYLVDSFAEVNPSEGIFMIYLTTSPGKQGRARLRLRQLLTALYQTGLDGQSLEIHKNHASADWLRLIESKNRKTFYLAFFEALGLGHEFLNRIAADIKEVQLQDFNLFLKKILNPDRLVECIIGPGDQSDTTSRIPPA